MLKRSLREFSLKWIEPAKHPHLEVDFTVTNQCMLVATNASGVTVGFTLFEPRNLDDQFFTRLALRRQRPESSGLSFALYIPNFLSHRFEAQRHAHNGVAVTYTSFLKFIISKGVFELRHKMRVINVDDSPVLLKFLKHTLDDLGFIDVVAQVSRSSDAVETISSLKPDAVTMDIQMPGMNGVEVVQKLLENSYYPILMISSLNLEEGSLVFDALNSGAFDYISKPKIEDRVAFRDELHSKLLLAIEGKQAHSSLKKLKVNGKITNQMAPGQSFKSELVWAIGASTGGTQALTHVFTSMPNNIPPTLVVQHIPPVFSKSFADSLNHLCPFVVKEAQDGEALLTNHVYIAPGGAQMKIQKTQNTYVIRVTDDEPVNRFKPSVDYLFNNLSTHTDLGFVAGILTGMGKDGAQGLLALKKAGAQTFAQDEETSTVYGMPRAAFEIGATKNVCPLDQVATTILSLSNSATKKQAA